MKGTIEGAEKAPIAVEVTQNGAWLPLDTLRTDAKGRFSYSHARAGYPDIYRLTYDGRSVYFPIDSIETITITTTTESFGPEATVEGSASANVIKQVDARIQEAVNALGVDGALNDSTLKSDLTNMILAEPAGISAYYIICKQIDGKFLFSPNAPRDNRVLGAVANAFSQQRPDDPRTRFLSNVYLANRRAMSPNTAQRDTVAISELAFFPIELMDNVGKSHSLADAVAANKVVLVNFTAYEAQESPAFNMVLSEAYNRYHNRGFEIYQVSLDDDEFVWKSAARNIPWITVYCPPTGPRRQLISQYNLQGLPTSYIIANGEIVDRVENVDNLDSKISSRL